MTGDQELDRQRDALLHLGVPQLCDVEDEQFLAAVDRLRPQLRTEAPDLPADRARVPFVVVVTGGADAGMRAAEQQVPLLHLAGRGEPGVLDRNHGPAGLREYRPIEAVVLPPSAVYALADVERGEEFCGVPPQEALPQILARGRTPLTIAEGIALVLLRPDVLEKNRCFMVSGSRRGDRRVPAVWISGKAPKLGWCWDGNPHTWLGVASVGARLAPSALSAG